MYVLGTTIYLITLRLAKYQIKICNTSVSLRYVHVKVMAIGECSIVCMKLPHPLPPKLKFLDQTLHVHVRSSI